MNREPAATAASAVPAARGRKMSITRLVEMTVEKVEKTVEKVKKVDKVLHPSDHPPVAPKPPLIQRISGVDDPSRIPIIGKLLPKPKPKVTPLSGRALRRSSSMPAGFRQVPLHHQSHMEGKIRPIDPERSRAGPRPPKPSLGLNKKDPLPPLPSILKVRSVEQSEMFPTAPTGDIPSARDLGSATRTFKRRSRSFSNFESVVIAPSGHERTKYSVRFELQTTSEREEDGQTDELHQEEKAGPTQQVRHEHSNSNQEAAQSNFEPPSIVGVDAELGSGRGASKEQEHSSQKNVKPTTEKGTYETKKQVGFPEHPRERQHMHITIQQHDLHGDNKIADAKRADEGRRDARECKSDEARKPAARVQPRDLCHRTSSTVAGIQAIECHRSDSKVLTSTLAAAPAISQQSREEPAKPANTNLQAQAVQRARAGSKGEEELATQQRVRRSVSVSGLEDLAVKMKEINHRQGPAHIDSGVHVQSGAHADRGPVSTQTLKTRPSRVNLGPPPSASAGAAQYLTRPSSNASSRPQLAKGNPSQQRVPAVCNTTRLMTGDTFPAKHAFNASSTSTRTGVSVLNAHPSTASTASIYSGKAASSHLSANNETYASPRVRLKSPPPQPAFQYESEPPSPTPSSVSSTGATIFLSECGVSEYAGSVPSHLSFSGESSFANDNDEDMHQRKHIQTLPVHSSKSADILRRVRQQEEEDRAQRERVHRDVQANSLEGVSVAKAVSMWEGMSKDKQRRDEKDVKDAGKERERLWEREMGREKEKESIYGKDMAKECSHPVPKVDIRDSHAPTPSLTAMPTILPLKIRKKTSTALRLN